VRVAAVNAAGRDLAETASTAVVTAADAAAGASSGSGSAAQQAAATAGATSSGSSAAATASGFPPDLIATVRPRASRLAPLGVRVSGVRCDHRRCTATVMSSGPASTVKVVLRRGARSLTWTRRSASRRPMHVSLKPRAHLRAGRYTVVATVSEASGATKSVRRAITVR
jgi:hypothetical protein